MQNKNVNITYDETLAIKEQCAIRIEVFIKAALKAVVGQYELFTDRNTRDHLVRDLAHKNIKIIAKIGVRNLKERNVDTKRYKSQTSPN